MNKKLLSETLRLAIERSHVELIIGNRNNKTLVRIHYASPLNQVAARINSKLGLIFYDERKLEVDRQWDMEIAKRKAPSPAVTSTSA